MRYIDTEPLLKEINRIEEEARKVRVSGTDKEAIGADGKIKLCLKLKSLIDYLQQEQQDINLEKEFNVFLDNIEGAPRMWHSDEQIEWAKDIARHFYELGKNSK